MDPKEYTEKHRITYYETDVTRKANLPMLLNMAVLVSEDQNEALNVGPDFVQSLGLGWVVIQYSIDIYRRPTSNEHVTLKTRSDSYNKFFANRQFWIIDDDDNTCVYINSNWVAINIQNRKLSSIPKELVEPYHAEEVKFMPHLRRPSRISKDSEVNSRNYRVRYSDIDINRHVNNSKYLDWMCDVLSADFLLQYKPLHIDLKFKNEVHYGTEVKSMVSKETKENGQLLTKHEIQSENQNAAVANIIWSKK